MAEILVFGTLVWKPVAQDAGHHSVRHRPLVYLDDVTERRHAVAIGPGTTVLAIGGFDLVVSS